MSDTPLTDAEMCDGWSGDAFAVSVEFARNLEKQLAERDAALARCVEALWSANESLWNNALNDAARKLEQVIASLPASAQATAKVLAAAKETQEKYNELLYGVSIKHPNETRHETALRYIRQAEYPQNTVAYEAIREEKETK